MPLASIHQVLNRLQTEPAWDDVRRFWGILQAWESVVGAMVAKQTQPIRVVAGDTLQVAVASGAWAQTLSFERVRILVKLNQHLQTPLQDIHFSIRDWPGQQQSFRSLTTPTKNSNSSPLSQTKTHHPPSPPQTATAAFEKWSTGVKTYAARLPLCPCCQCPTPRPELDQWRTCRLCHARLKLVQAPGSNG